MIKMSLRDWFAGQALASFPVDADFRKPTDTHERDKARAKSAYRIADAMLEERENK